MQFCVCSCVCVVQSGSRLKVRSKAMVLAGGKAAITPELQTRGKSEIHSQILMMFSFGVKNPNMSIAQ